MTVSCVWEHNGPDTLLYAVHFPGACARGATLEEALGKMPREISSYCAWAGLEKPEDTLVQITQEIPCTLAVADADSCALSSEERPPLTGEEYRKLKALALKSAADFETLYRAMPDRDFALVPKRGTFYGKVPRSAREMYDHTKNVNAYYFAEIEVDADNEGSILECRQRGFAALEQIPGFLDNPVIPGSYGEAWTLRKVLRRFIWHDRIHGRAMYRRAAAAFGRDAIPNPYCFTE